MNTGNQEIDKQNRFCIFNITDQISRIALRLAVYALFMIFALESLRIICRYFFNQPLNWVPGIVTLLTAWSVFLGVGYYLYVNDVITIDYFFERWFSLKLQKVLTVCIRMIIVVFTFLGAWYGWQSVLMSNYKSSISVIRMKYYWFTLPLVLGMLLGLLGNIKRLVQRCDID